MAHQNGLTPESLKELVEVFGEDVVASLPFDLTSIVNFVAATESAWDRKAPAHGPIWNPYVEFPQGWGR